MKGKKVFKRNEFYVAMTIILLSVIIHTKSGQFFTSNNIVDLLRSIIVPGMLACGLMMVIASGNIDISFPAIAMLSMFSVTKLFSDIDYQGPVILAFLIAGCIGLVLGLINGLLTAWLKLPTLIITLGTGSAFLGITQGILKSSVISVIPGPLAKLSKTFLFTAENKGLGISSSLPVLFILLVLIIIVVSLIMRYTMLGRGVYAVGGDIAAAERVGFNVPMIQIFVFVFMGGLAGITGMTQVALSNMCQINFFDGYEMTIIAAVVLGGTNIAGGSGTVLGTVLGVTLMKLISNNLILLGIPTSWSKFVTGILIVLGVAFSAYQLLFSQRKIASNILKPSVKGKVGE